MKPPPMQEFIAGIFFSPLLVPLLPSVFGLPVVYFGMPVGVSRKMMHITFVGVLPLLIISATLGGENEAMATEVGKLDMTLPAAIWRTSVWEGFLAQWGYL